jgi:hypothetical protein
MKFYDPQFHEVPVLRGQSLLAPYFALAEANGGVICGGAARWACSPRANPVGFSDIDIYPKTEADVDRLVGALKKAGFSLSEESDFSYTFKPRKRRRLGESTDPLDYSRRLLAQLNRIKGRHFIISGHEVQVIKPVVDGVYVTMGDTKTVLSHFDFSVARVGLLRADDNGLPTHALADTYFLHDEMKRHIRIGMVHCPLSSIPRIIKYSRKGYWVKVRELLNLFVDWDERDSDWREALLTFFMLSDAGDITAEEITRLEQMLWID